jgi:tRNA nucleotidyltransferase/poly(A) polymerase
MITLDTKVNWIITEVYYAFNPDQDGNRALFYKEVTGANNSTTREAYELLKIIHGKNPSKVYEVFVS